MTFEALGTYHVKCCATCQHWDDLSDAIAIGLCRANQYLPEGIGTQWTSPATTDLQLCSKWQQKPDD